MSKKKKTTIVQIVGLTEDTNYICMEDQQQLGNVSIINPVNLDYCGMEQCESGYAFGPFVRTCYVVHMVVSGRGALYKNGVCYPVETGQAFIIYPNEETTYQADRDDPWKYMWIGFHGIQAEEMMKRAGFSEKNPVVSISDMNACEKVMQQMLAVRDLSYVNELFRISALYQLIGQIIRMTNVTSYENAAIKTADQRYIKTAIAIMMGSYNKNIKVEEIAKSIGISRSYLTSIFKAEMKISPQEFLIRYRMERAASLLVTTDNPINLIAVEVGYNDALAFSKAFRKYYNCSPSDYRFKETVLKVQKNKGDYKGALL